MSWLENVHGQDNSHRVTIIARILTAWAGKLLVGIPEGN